MSMIELKNMSAKCVEQDDTKTYVMHRVEYDLKEDGVWVGKTTFVRATDPMDAIKYVRGGYYGE
jgi:hypothetical protein